jgi:hypothetical protein
VTFIVAPIHVTHLIVLALRGYKHEITVYIQPLMSLFPLHRSLPLSDKTVVSTVALGECRFWTRGVADETWVLVERTRDSGLGILRVFRIWYNNNLVASFFFYFSKSKSIATVLDHFSKGLLRMQRLLVCAAAVVLYY